MHLCTVCERTNLNISQKSKPICAMTYDDRNEKVVKSYSAISTSKKKPLENIS